MVRVRGVQFSSLSCVSRRDGGHLMVDVTCWTNWTIEVIPLTDEGLHMPCVLYRPQVLGHRSDETHTTMLQASEFVCSSKAWIRNKCPSIEFLVRGHMVKCLEITR